MQEVGIVGYGVALPWQRISIGRDSYRTIDDLPDDSITFGVEASMNAIRMSKINPMDIGAVISGSISKPYAVGQNARHIATYVGVGDDVFTSDIEAGNSGGMQAVSFIHSEIKAGKIKYGLAIGTDSGSVSEENIDGSGAVAVILGGQNPIATIKDIKAFSSFDQEFFRREGSSQLKYIEREHLEEHYACKTIEAMRILLEANKKNARDFDYLTFSQPSYNSLRPLFRKLRESSGGYDRLKLEQRDIEQKIIPWVRVLEIGDTHNASSLISMASMLDDVQDKEKNILVTSYSPDLSIAMWLTTEDFIQKRRTGPTTQDYIDRMIEIRPTRYRDKIRFRAVRALEERFARPARIVGTISAMEGSTTKKITLCRGCERVYAYETISGKCLDPDCDPKKTELKSIELPIHATLESFYKLKAIKREFIKKGKMIIERRRKTFDILNKGQVIIVDCEESQLTKGIPVEMVIRMLDVRGKEGWLEYDPAYRPLIEKI